MALWWGVVCGPVEGTGVPAGGRVAGIAGDQRGALFGQACFQPGMAKNTYGTGSFVLMNVGETCPAPTEGLLTTVGWTVPAQVLGRTGDDVTHYALEGAIFITGAAVQWLRDGLGIIDEASEVGPLAASVDDTAGVVFVPAFTGLGAPYWQPDARGTIVGLSRGSTRAHIARSAFESLAFQTAALFYAMAQHAPRPGLPTPTKSRVYGGAARTAVLTPTHDASPGN